MFKKNMFAVFAAAFLVCALAGAATVLAASATNSYVSPNAARPLNSCPILKTAPVASSYVQSPVCANLPTHNNYTITYRQWIVTPQDYFITHMCYRPTCAYEAIKYATEPNTSIPGLIGYPIQPLAPNVNGILTALGSFTVSKLKNSRTQVYGSQGTQTQVVLSQTYLQGSNQLNFPQVQDGLQKTPSGAANDVKSYKDNGSHIQSSTPRYYSPLLPGSSFMDSLTGGFNPNPAGDPRTGDMGKIEPGGGSSSIQGLLWAWRMVSNNWVGLWSGVTSNYGQITPTNLPLKTDLKNIIIITDGEDTDGPNDPLNNTLSSIGALPPVNLGDGSGGNVYFDGSIPGSMGQGLSATADALAGEVCDAYAPVASIQNSDYQNLCDSLYEEGIRVHVIYYGYNKTGTDDRLGYCAARTRGLKFNNQLNLVSAFNQIFASIAAENIRLIEK